MLSGRALQRFVAPCVFVVAAFVLGFATRIAGVGKWHQNHAVYFQQVDAFLHGRLAISSEPSAVKMDMAWHNGGVQQIWGLGVPTLMVPGQLLANMVLGGDPFPERGLFLLLLAGLGYGTFRVLRPIVRPSCAAGAGLALIFFPPFLSLLLSRYQIWEEAVAYEYLVVGYLLIAVASLVVRPSGGGFIVVCALAGFAPFVRPTAVFYAIAAVLVAFTVYKPAVIDRAKLVGAVLGLAFAAVMLVTNATRFGAPLEFGHSIHTNLYNLVDYTTTFENPFRQSTFASATKDFIGSFNYTDIPGWKGFHVTGLFPWQSPIFRWHEFYFRVYDGSFLLLLVLGWSLGGLLLWRRRARALDPLERVIVALEVWSLISFAGLFAFYLKIPGLSSRFLVDFAPAIAAGFVGVMLYFASRLEISLVRRERLIFASLLGVGCLWFAAEAILVTRPGAQLPSTTAKAVTLDEFKSTLNRPAAPAQIPAYYSLGTDPRSSNIPFNGLGWDSAGGITAPYMVFFVKDPKSIRLVFSVDAGAPLSAYAPVAAKLGLEYLPKIAETEADHLRTLTFGPPRNPISQKGVQMLAVKTVEPSALTNLQDLGLRLVEVRWND